MGQGNRILLIELAKYSTEAGLIPAGLEALGLDAHLGRLVLAHKERVSRVTVSPIVRFASTIAILASRPSMGITRAQNKPLLTIT